MKTVNVDVSGMLSPLSARGVEKQLARLRGVKKVVVNYVAGSATVTYYVEGQATPVTRTVPLGATSRTTINVHDAQSASNPRREEKQRDEQEQQPAPCRCHRAFERQMLGKLLVMNVDHSPAAEADLDRVGQLHGVQGVGPRRRRSIS